MADQSLAKGPGRIAFERAMEANRLAKNSLWRKLDRTAYRSRLRCEYCGRTERSGGVLIVHYECEGMLWPDVPCNLHARLCVNCYERLKANKRNIWCRLHKR